MHSFSLSIFFSLEILGIRVDILELYQFIANHLDDDGEKTNLHMNEIICCSPSEVFQ